MTEQKQLPARMGHGVVLTTVADIKEMANLLFSSGCFGGPNDIGKACLKIVAGQEYGFTPYISMTGIHIIQGKPTLSSNLVAAAIKRSGRYDYKVKKNTAEGCTLAAYERGKLLGESTFTFAEAQKAGLISNPTWQKYPRQMCFARTITELARTYMPDVFGGPVYTPEDFDVATDGTEIIEGQVVESEAPKQQDSAPSAKSVDSTSNDAGTTDTAQQSTQAKSEPTPTLTQEIEQAEEVSFEDEVSVDECKARVKAAAIKAGYLGSAVGVVALQHFGISKVNLEEKIRQSLGDMIAWFEANPSPSPGQDVKFDVNGFAIKAV